MKRFLPARAHAVIDYLTAGIWMIGPELFRIRWVPGSALGPKLFGASTLVNTTLTDWGPREGLEYGAARAWSVKTHLVLDVGGATVVAVLPWLTGSRRGGWNYWVPHAGALALELVSAAITEIPQEQRKRRA